MDITKIDDIKELKSLAFDEMVKIETAQNNLRVLQARITQLEDQAARDANPIEGQ